MQNIEEKIKYIYFNTDGIYYFLSNQGINDHSKRCLLRRFFILIDSYLEMIGFLKNKLFKEKIIDLKTKQSLENEIKAIRDEWDNNYEIIRNKFSAHHQTIDFIILIEWWNEIDYSTVTYFYEGLRNIRGILLDDAGFTTITPVDYCEIDFSDTCLKENSKSDFFIALDRLAISKKNTVSMLSHDEFQKKCMLILSIVDFIFINCAVTTKTQNYDKNYKNILFDTAWLLICCDTISLIQNMYEDDVYGDSLMTLSPQHWAGIQIIKYGNSARDSIIEDSLINLRNKLAAHIDTKDEFIMLLKMFDDFNLKKLHEYCMSHMQTFQRACLSDIRTKMFAFRDQKLSRDILDISYTRHKSVNN